MKERMFPPADSSDIRPLTAGRLISGRYRVECLIGRGGMGAVYEATDQRLNGSVALKQMLLSGDQSNRAFEHEAHLLACLRHPSLPRVIDYFIDADGQFLVMEFFPGNDLARLLEQRGEPFPLTQVLDWADQLLATLIYLHEHDPQIIHRDIKPQNMKLTDQGEVVLLDFGLAKSQAAQHTRRTSSGSIVGYTPMYAPLEQIQGTGTDPRSDLYALGATLHHLLTNTPPVDTLTRAAASVSHQPDPQQPAHHINPEVPPAIGDVLARAMALDPNQRPPTASLLRIELQQARGSTAAPQPAPPPRPSWEHETQYDAPPPDSAPTQAPAHGFAPAAGNYAAAADVPTMARSTIRQPAPAELPVQPEAAPPQPRPGHAAHRPERRYRSVFWPLLMIGVGALWLLKSLDILPQINLSLFWRLWPLYLIVIGLDMITGKRSQTANTIIGAAGAVLVLGLVMFGSLFGPQATGAAQTRDITTPLGAAERATIEMELRGGDIVLYALEDSANLLEGELTYAGDLNFAAGSTTSEERLVRLRVNDMSTPFSFFGSAWPTWDIGLTPEIPLNLALRSGAGDADLDLRGLSLSRLTLERGAGDIDVILPDSAGAYVAELQGGAGDASIDIEEGATIERLTLHTGAGDTTLTLDDNVALTADIASGIGDIEINVPDDAAIRLESTAGIGDVSVPDTFEPIRADGERQVWQTPDFAQASRQIVLTFEGGVGDLEIDD
jgi:serine/threonine protein kinase